MSPITSSLPSLPHPSTLDVADAYRSDPVVAMRSVVSSLWHDLWHAALTSPWVAIAVMVPAVAVLIGCTRVTVRRG